MTESMYYVLLALRRPLYGEQILQEILRISHGRVRLGPGTLLTLLTQLEKKRFIALLTGGDGQRIAYAATAEGLQALKNELALLTAMASDGNACAEELPV